MADTAAVAAEAVATAVVVMAVIAAATVVVTAMVTVVVTEGKSTFLCALRVWFGGFTLKIGPPFLQQKRARLSTPRFRLTFLRHFY